MSDYVQKVLREIQSKRDAKLIGAELSGHIAEKQALYRERGFDPAAAARMAEAAMGKEAETVGAALSALHRRSRARDCALCLLCMAALFADGLEMLHLNGFAYTYTGLHPETPIDFFDLPLAVFALVPVALLAYRRRLVLPPLTAGILCFFTAGATLPTAFFWAKLVSGGLTDALARTAPFTAAWPALRWAHLALITAEGLSLAVLSAFGWRRRTARGGKRDKPVGRAIVLALSAVLALQIGTPLLACALSGRPATGELVYYRDQPIVHASLYGSGCAIVGADGNCYTRTWSADGLTGKLAAEYELRYQFLSKDETFARIYDKGDARAIWLFHGGGAIVTRSDECWIYLSWMDPFAEPTLFCGDTVKALAEHGRLFVLRTDGAFGWYSLDDPARVFHPLLENVKDFALTDSILWKSSPDSISLESSPEAGLMPVLCENGDLRLYDPASVRDLGLFLTDVRSIAFDFYPVLYGDSSRRMNCCYLLTWTDRNNVAWCMRWNERTGKRWRDGETEPNPAGYTMQGPKRLGENVRQTALYEDQGVLTLSVDGDVCLYTAEALFGAGPYEGKPLCGEGASMTSCCDAAILIKNDGSFLEGGFFIQIHKNLPGEKD